MHNTPPGNTIAENTIFDRLEKEDPESLNNLFKEVGVTDVALDEKRRLNENKELDREKLFDDQLHDTVIESLKKSPGSSGGNELEAKFTAILPAVRVQYIR